MDAKSLLPVDFDSIIRELPENMATLYTKLRASVISLSTATTQILINPAELVSTYTTNSQLKSLIDTIACSLSAPMYLPITRNMVNERDDENDVIDRPATILAHAIQILLFAPTQWNPNIVYKSDNGDYTHRYPTPAGHGGNCRTVAERFSLEDLHRAILLMHLAISRRAPGNNVYSARPPRSLEKFPGYYGVNLQRPTLDGPLTYTDTQIANARLLDRPLSEMAFLSQELIHVEDQDSEEVNQMPSNIPLPMLNDTVSSNMDEERTWVMDLLTQFVESASMRQGLLGHHKNTSSDLQESKPLYDILEPMTKEEQVILPRKARARYNWEDPDAVLRKVISHATSFKPMAEEQKLLEFSEHGKASSAMQEFIATHPNQEQGPLETMCRSYALEMIFKGHPPPEDTNLIQVCNRFGIQWPEMKLYPNSEVEPLKPHQIAG